MMLSIYTDASSSGHGKDPNALCGWAWMAFTDETCTTELAQAWGTLNAQCGIHVAEYVAVLQALAWCAQNLVMNPMIHVDNKIVTGQLLGTMRVHNVYLHALWHASQTYIQTTGATIVPINRTANRAHKLASDARLGHI